MRCFVAVWPSAELGAALASLPRPVTDGVKWTGPEQWHVTLRFFGNLGGPEVPEAVDAVRQLATAWRGTVSARGGPVTRLLGPGLIVWPVEGLDKLAREVESVTAGLGEAPPARPFVGHLTIARARRGVDLRRTRHLLTPLSAGWEVRSVCLVESQLHPQGARYRQVAEVPIG